MVTRECRRTPAIAGSCRPVGVLRGSSGATRPDPRFGQVQSAIHARRQSDRCVERRPRRVEDAGREIDRLAGATVGTERGERLRFGPADQSREAPILEQQARHNRQQGRQSGPRGTAWPVASLHRCGRLLMRLAGDGDVIAAAGQQTSRAPASTTSSANATPVNSRSQTPGPRITADYFPCWTVWALSIARSVKTVSGPAARPGQRIVTRSIFSILPRPTVTGNSL